MYTPCVTLNQVAHLEAQTVLHRGKHRKRDPTPRSHQQMNQDRSDPLPSHKTRLGLHSYQQQMMEVD